MDSETDCKIALLLGSTNDYSHTPGVCCKRKYKVLHLRRKKNHTSEWDGGRLSAKQLCRKAPGGAKGQ